MNYFFDTEFHARYIGGVYIIEPISIGILCEDGRTLYLECNDFDIKAAINNKWLYENVIKKLEWQNSEIYDSYSQKDIKQAIIDFVGNVQNPVFYAYYAAYDWMFLCQLFGGMMELPERFPKYCRDLKQMLDERIENWIRINEYSKHNFFELLNIVKEHLWCFKKNENEHKASEDAMFNRNLYMCMKSGDVEHILDNVLNLPL